MRGSDAFTTRGSDAFTARGSDAFTARGSDPQNAGTSVVSGKERKKVSRSVVAILIGIER